MKERFRYKNKHEEYKNYHIREHLCLKDVTIKWKFDLEEMKSLTSNES